MPELLQLQVPDLDPELSLKIEQGVIRGHDTRSDMEVLLPGWTVAVVCPSGK